MVLWVADYYLLLRSVVSTEAWKMLRNWNIFHSPSPGSPMKILLLQHDPLDGPVTWSSGPVGAGIRWRPAWCARMPSSAAAGIFRPHLVSLGGPMGAYEEESTRGSRWRRVSAAGRRDRKKILGLCLGAQLLADALGGRAFRHTCKEFGWQPIEPLGAGREWFGTEDVFYAFSGTATLLSGGGDLAVTKRPSSRPSCSGAGREILSSVSSSIWSGPRRWPARPCRTGRCPAPLAFRSGPGGNPCRSFPLRGNTLPVLRDTWGTIWPRIDFRSRLRKAGRMLPVAPGIVAGLIGSL